MLRQDRLREILRILFAAMDRGVACRLGLTLVLVVGGGLMAGAAPLALKQLVDAAAQPAPHAPGSATVTGLAVLYLLALCTGRLLTEIRPKLASAAEQRLQARLRQRFFAHLLGLRPGIHLEHRSGALMQTLQQALTGYQLIVTHLVGSVVPVLVEVVTALVVLVHLGQPALTATFAATSLAYVLVFSTGSAGLRKPASAVAGASLELHATVADALLHREMLKCFGAEPATKRRLAERSDDLERCWHALHRQRTAVGLALAAVFTVSTVVTLVLATASVVAGTLTIGGFVLANLYMLQLVRPLEALGLAARDLAQAQSFIRPLVALLAEPTEEMAVPTPVPDPGPRTPSGPGRRPRPAPRLDFRGVHFGYVEGRPVLAGLNLDIEGGRHVAIVGASGCGKSSLVRLLLRLAEPREGCILIDRQPIDTLPLPALRRLIGLVPQDVTLLDDSVAANIALGHDGASRGDIERAARTACLHEVIASWPAGYDTPVGERGLRVSGGERQRIAIARAVLKQPRIFLFDEATSMLDRLTEAEVLHRLQYATAGCTTITISHRLSTLRQADEIVVIEHGRIAERGRHAQLLSNDGAYARLWRAQRRGERA